MSNKVQIFTDGGARGNPGPAGIGVVVIINGEPIHKIAQKIGKATNNEAEYLALTESIKWLLGSEYVGNETSPKEELLLVEWFLDSKLVVEQINKNWKIKQPHLKELAVKVWELLEELNKLGCEHKLSHVVREKNKVADSLVNQALDA